MMIALVALQLVQAQPIARPAVTTAVRTDLAVASVSPKQRKLAEAQTLLADAQKVQASYAPGPGQPSKIQLDRSIDRMKDQLDSMSEMGETEALRLQMAMDRMSKMMAALSNILKKISDTQNSIVQNIK